MKMQTRALVVSLAAPAARAGVGLAPRLQPGGDENGGAFRGVLGPCEEDHGIYHAYVPDGEPYHCDLAEVELAWKEAHYPDEDLCDFGVSELVPRPQIVDGKPVWGAKWDEDSRYPSADPKLMFHNVGCVASSQHSGSALIGGGTSGAVVHQQLCEAGVLPSCSPRFANQTLYWPASMGIYRINEQMGDFIKAWRSQYHRPNIAFGAQEGYYGGWMRKVVRCSDIPEKLMNIPGGMVSAEINLESSRESSLEFATRTWLGMQSLLTKDHLTPSFHSPADWESDPPGPPPTPTININVVDRQAEITLSGAEDKWFGIGFGAEQMSDHPHAVIVDASGAIMELTLGTYTVDTVLDTQFQEVSHSVVSGIRTVVLSRDASAASPERFAFPPAGTEVKYIWAVGITPDFSTHGPAAWPATTTVTGNAVPQLV